tara:strand:+ start:4740 stop:5219 length:480 start_codon:yes stop_codon:yes gene_type:complete
MENKENIFERLGKIRLHIAGEYADKFTTLTEKSTNRGQNRVLHFIFASIASSKNEFYADFSKRKVSDKGTGFNDKNVYEHSGVAASNSDEQIMLILSIAYQYYKDYKKSINSFDEIYSMENREIVNPTNLAATRGLEILIEDDFDFDNDDIFKNLREYY